MRTYANLSELLDGEGYESPYRLGRSLYKYTDCGPWVSFRTPGLGVDDFGRRQSVYYENAAASGWGVHLWAPHCTGIDIGSIVEGSDAEVGPIKLTFPFTSEQFWDAVEEVNSEACSLWEEANSEESEDE